MPPADTFDEERDLYESYLAAVAELRRRYLAGEPMPEGWDPREREARDAARD